MDPKAGGGEEDDCVDSGAETGGEPRGQGRAGGEGEHSELRGGSSLEGPFWTLRQVAWVGLGPRGLLLPPRVPREAGGNRGEPIWVGLENRTAWFVAARSGRSLPEGQESGRTLGSE